MNDIIFTVLEAIIVAGIAALMRYLIPLVITILRSHNYNFAADMVEVAVRAAEQIFDGAKRGEEKYEYVKKHLISELAAYKITITEDQLNTLIESAVRAMNKEDEWLKGETE